MTLKTVDLILSSKIFFTTCCCSIFRGLYLVIHTQILPCIASLWVMSFLVHCCESTSIGVNVYFPWISLSWHVFRGVNGEVLNSSYSHQRNGFSFIVTIKCASGVYGGGLWLSEGLRGSRGSLVPSHGRSKHVEITDSSREQLERVLLKQASPMRTPTADQVPMGSSRLRASAMLKRIQDGPFLDINGIMGSLSMAF